MQGAPPQVTAARRFSPAMVAATVTVLTVLHLGLNGYSFGGASETAASPSSDHANILPWIYWYQDQTLFPHDLQIQSGAGYDTVLWRAIAWVARAIDLEWTFFAVHTLALAASYLALFLLARLWSATDWAGALAGLLFVVVRGTPAGVATHDPALYTRGAALPLALFALLFVLRVRPYAGFALLLAAHLIHPLTAFYALAIAGPAALVDSRLRWGHRLTPVALFVVAAIAASMLMGGGAPLHVGAPSAQWMQLQIGNNAMHLFPNRWGERVWREFAVCALFLLLPILSPQRPSEHRVAAILIIGGGGLLAMVGWITTYQVKSMLFMQLQPFRGLQLVTVLALVFAATQIAEVLSASRREALPAAAASLVLVGLMATHTYLIAAGFAFLVAVTTRGMQRAALLAASSATLIWFTRSDTPADLARAAPSVTHSYGVMGAVIVVTGLTLLTVVPWLMRDRARFAGPATCGLLVLACLIAQGLNRGRDGRVRYAGPTDLPFVAHDNAWIDVQRWIRANTPTDAYVLTPPDLEGFRSYSRRSQFGDWKQGTLSMFHEPFGMEWARRMGGFMRRQLDRRPWHNLRLNYDAFGPPEIDPLRSKFGLTHMVTRSRGLPYRQLYSNGVYQVYELSEVHFLRQQ